MMKAAQFTKPGGNLEIVQVPIPKVAPGEIRIKVKSCGICHGDTTVKYGAMGVKFPRIPGHEVVGTVDEIGEGVRGFSKGEIVGVGWFGGHCGECNACMKNLWIGCKNSKACGVHFDGGYAEYMVAPHDAVAHVPEGMETLDVGPLMCAGITTFNSLRNCGVPAGEVVAVQGVGGLGHLGIQFANKLGYEVVAISSGKDKETLAKKLGAHHYVDASNPAEACAQIQKLGGASAILITAPNTKAAEDLIPALGFGGKMIIVAALMQELKVNTLHLLMQRQSIVAWSSGDTRDGEATLKFCKCTGVKPMVETFPLEKANEGFDSMMTNKARFRCVLKISD